MKKGTTKKPYGMKTKKVGGVEVLVNHPKLDYSAIGKKIKSAAKAVKKAVTKPTPTPNAKAKAKAKKKAAAKKKSY
jgi:ribosomal protein S10